MSKKQQLHVLLVEDSPGDTKLIVHQIERTGYQLIWERVDSAAKLRAALLRDTWDVVLCNYNMSGLNGTEALAIVRESGRDLPIIFVSGTVGEDMAVEAMRAGAHDYLVKGNLNRLVPAIERELREAEERRQRRQAEAALRDNERLLRLIMDLVPHHIFAKDREGRYLLLNRATGESCGLRPEEMVGCLEWELRTDMDQVENLLRDDREVIDSGRPKFIPEEPITYSDGQVHLLQTTKIPFTLPGKTERAVLGVAVDITERKQAEASLRASERLYYSLVEQLPQAIFRLDREGRITFGNTQYCRLLGRELKDLLGKTDADLFPPDLAANYWANSRQVMGTGEVFEVVERHVGPDGGESYVQVLKSPLRGDDGEVIGIQGIFWDVTARKRLEDEREITVRLLSLFNTNAGLHELIRQVTALVREWLGCDAVGIRLRQGDDYPYFETSGFPEQFVQLENQLCLRDSHGRPVRDADGNPLLECMCGNVLCGRFNPAKPFFTARGSFWTNSTTALLAGTTEADRMASTRNRCNGEGYESVALVALRVGEITYGLLQINHKRRNLFTPERIALLERLADSLAVAIAHRLTQERLRTSEEKFRQITETIDEVFWMADPQIRTMIYVSPAYETVWGRSCASLYENPLSFLEAIHADDRERVQADLVFQKENKPFDHEYRIVRPDGSVCWIRDRGFPVFDQARQVTHYVGVAQDVTQTRQLEAQFRQAQKMETVGRLAGGVAHDFNNLLTAIIGFSDVALNQIAADDSIRRPIEEVKAAGERAAALTRQLLAFSRKQTLQPQILDLNVLVANLDKMLRRLIGEDINLTIRFDPALDRVKADPGQIEQVIINLVVNARDAMPEGGKLIIQTSNQELDQTYADQHSEATPGHYVLLTITDTGTGMAEEVKTHLFEPFFTTKGLSRGTGLGLATVYGIVKQSGGNIGVYSEPGQGTVFKIYLPSVEKNVKSATPAKTARQLPSGRETILLVEDEIQVRNLARIILKACGYHVLEAGNGTEAVQLAKQHAGKIQLLLTDVIMPEMGGRVLAPLVANWNPGLKVLFMSGYTDTPNIRQDLLDADSAFLQKPFTQEILARKVRELLDPPY